MKRISILMSSVLVSAAAVAALPKVDGVNLSQTGDVVCISYTLTGEPAVVTVDILTNTVAGASGNWVSVGGRGMGLLGGEANKLVRVLDEPVSAYWFPMHVCTDGSLDVSNVRAIVTAWPTNAPPDYMVVSLTGPTNDAVRFYASTNALPGGFSDVSYKTTKLVLRKIPAANVVWRMGSPTDEDGCQASDVAHRVMLTEDYYLAIYEYTQAQFESIGISHWNKFSGDADSPLYPADSCGNTQLRGNPWGMVTDASLFGKLRRQSGVSDMDLPTEAQWEYACRAGCGGQYCYSSTAGELMRNYGWYYYSASGKPHVVGSLRPNAWGLYDMHGNVLELIRDRGSAAAANIPKYTATFASGWETGAVTVNPTGITDEDVAVANMRGGYYSSEALECRSGRRRQGSVDYDAQNHGGTVGFRVSCSVRAAVR